MEKIIVAEIWLMISGYLLKYLLMPLALDRQVFFPEMKICDSRHIKSAAIKERTVKNEICFMECKRTPGVYAKGLSGCSE